MSLHEFPDMVQRSEDWYAARCGIVTASVVGRLITPAKKETAQNGESRSIALALVAERLAGFVDPTWKSLDMWRGSDEEPLAAEVYAEHYSPVDSCGFMVRDDWGFAVGYSPDGLVGDVGLIEVKCLRGKGHVQAILADEVPAEYMPQIQAGLLVSGRDWCDFVSYYGGLPLWVKRVTPDPEWAAAIVTAAGEFEGHAKQMVAKYRAAVRGFPMTERHVLTDMEVVLNGSR